MSPRFLDCMWHHRAFPTKLLAILRRCGINQPLMALDGVQIPSRVKSGTDPLQVPGPDLLVFVKLDNVFFWYLSSTEFIARTGRERKCYMERCVAYVGKDDNRCYGSLLKVIEKRFRTILDELMV